MSSCVAADQKAMGEGYSLPVRCAGYPGHPLRMWCNYGLVSDVQREALSHDLSGLRIAVFDPRDPGGN